MDAKQHLYYALGILSYAIAKADGEIQPEERQMIHKIVVEESKHHIDFDYAEIIFSILQKDNPGVNKAYEWAMHSFNLGKQHFTTEMKEQFVAVIQKMEEAFPPATVEERNLIEKFSRSIWREEIGK